MCSHKPSHLIQKILINITAADVSSLNPSIFRTKSAHTLFFILPESTSTSPPVQT
ncbi:hypothetical protein HanPSC8_Chr16g0742731 [Helianthus annuus]|nr:hypothetical protein HanPSC8_Chr16g0742731 [Helianthus annuus]